MQIQIEPHKSEGYLTRKDKKGFCQVKLTKRKVAPISAQGITLVYSHDELKQLRDAIDNYLANLPKPHPHAELMALYAEDAKETDKPWKRWEIKGLGILPESWSTCPHHPGWREGWEYRRKSSV